jgi:hypothetical protein
MGPHVNESESYAEVGLDSSMPPIAWKDDSLISARVLFYSTIVISRLFDPIIKTHVF